MSLYLGIWKEVLPNGLEDLELQWLQPHYDDGLSRAELCQQPQNEHVGLSPGGSHCPAAVFLVYEVMGGSLCFLPSFSSLTATHLDLRVCTPCPFIAHAQSLQITACILAVPAH